MTMPPHEGAPGQTAFGDGPNLVFLSIGPRNRGVLIATSHDPVGSILPYGTACDLAYAILKLTGTREERESMIQQYVEKNP